MWGQRKKLYLALFFSVFVTALVLVKPGEADSDEIVLQLASETCPFRTSEEWQQFLEKSADHPKWVETCEDSTCDSDYFNYAKEHIQNVFEVCTDFIQRNELIEACTRNMRHFVPAWLDQHSDDSYGFRVDNSTYLSDQESPDKPEDMMKPPEAIIAALPNLGAVESAARKNGLKYLTHDSALGGFRTFVLKADPRGRFDQWMLLNLQKGQSEITQGTPLSMITVQKKDILGNSLSKVQNHFRDYTIHRSHSGGYELELNEMSNGKCYSCHTHGMRQLIARRTPILEARPVLGEAGYTENYRGSDADDFSFRRLMEFNRRIRSYGAPDWNDRIRPEDHGPALGEKQGCTECHDGRGRSFLNASTSHIQIRQKMVNELSMPPDNHLAQWLERREMKNPSLTAQEQRSFDHAHEVHLNLFNSFEESRFSALKEWLLKKPCRSGRGGH